MVGFFSFQLCFLHVFFPFCSFFFHLFLLVGGYLRVLYSKCCGKTFYYSQIQIMVQKLRLF